MSTERWCQVALRIPARQTYTYRVPESLTDFVQPGIRVVVPVRRETTVGVVRRCLQEAPAHPARDVVDIVDAEPWFDADLLALGDWLSEYYYCGPGEALFAMLPAGLAARVDTVYTHHPERVPTASLSPTERKLCLHLSAHPELPRRELLAAFPQQDTPRRLEKLVRQGTIDIRRRVRPHRVRMPSEPAVEWVGDRDPQQAKDNELALHLLNASGPVQARRLRERFPDAPRQLMRLARRKLVRRLRVPAPYAPELPATSPGPEVQLTPEQATAVETVSACLDSHRTFLLHGVTGSGKTEVYIRLIAHVLGEGRSALYLVPEIRLAGHLLGRLAPHFTEQVVMLHSGLTERERALVWQTIRKGERRLVVGTRSAVLAPLQKLGLIVVDEEQDASFKQDSPSPRYHGRDVAIWRAERQGCVCLLGSATPSLESWEHAATGKYGLLKLPRRIGSHPAPRVELIDRSKHVPRVPGGTITAVLERQIQSALQAGGQAILFLNRRGFSAVLRCAQCGHGAPCPDCAVAYTYHRERKQLRCHFCGRSEAAPDTCGSCGASQFVYPRAGTQQVEEELARLFPDARCARLDLDVASRRGKAEEILTDFGAQRLDILLGTQMVTKGLHFPRVAMVGVLNADQALEFPDFRAAERTAQMILQVAGRAGRGDIPGRVFAQTWSPEHPVFQLLHDGDYEQFAASELETRRLLEYPPCGRLIVVRAQSEKEEAAETSIRRLAGRLGERALRGVRLVGPAPAPLRKVRRQFRWQLFIKTRRIRATLAVLDVLLPETTAAGARFFVDVDAQNPW